MKNFLFITTSIITFVISFLGIWFIYYQLSLRAVSDSSTVVNFSVEEGSNFHSIAEKLKDSGLIRSKFVYRLYIKINKPSSIKAGVYQLNKNMSVAEIVEALSGDFKHDLNSVTITFKEGKNMRYIINQIVSNTDNTEEDILKTLKDEKYLKELIDKYWFITDEILNTDIYYSLEGYLYPNTYTFRKDVTVKEIFNVMIEQMDKNLSSYENDINASPYSSHQILTLASIVELEGVNDSDRSGIAGVFYNRINNNWNLGSDVTTYYGAGIDLNERDLTKEELNDNNPYNTRSSSMISKLPIGPICNPSLASIKAALYPQSHDYYYFVSDKNGKTYFTKTEQEHLSKKNELIEAGLWYTYE